MDYSCKSGLKGSDVLANSEKTGCEVIVHTNNKPLTFGVDRILANSDKRERSEVPSYLLPRMQFMVQPQIQVQMDIINSPGTITSNNKRLIRPQAIRIASESARDNGRGSGGGGQLLREPADCQPTHTQIHHRLPYPPTASSMFQAHHNHLPILRFNPALYPLAQKYQLGPHPHFLVQPHYTSEEAQRPETRDHRGTHTHSQVNSQPSSKRKRSWSRAVFSNLQRKGLEIAFGGQKYITKPDRRKLAARLGLTDAQVKVWFQNRRMKWRHTGEDRKAGGPTTTAAAAGGQPISKSVKEDKGGSPTSEEMYTSSDEESMCEDEIDVTD